MNKLFSGEETLLSAGIDIGTSTTKLVISRLTLMNMAGGTHVPRIEIIDKEILYRSPIYRTPLLSPSVIDLQAVDQIVRAEYEKAGITAEDIQTGAVIITGETATKQNAEEMVHHLSNNAGEFLVATAGPDLEGIIAAKGSGAFEYAKKTGKTVANVDIGGGTANIAVYEGKRLAGTCTLHIGGRLIEFEGNRVKSISAPIQGLLRQLGWELRPGDEKDDPVIRQVASYMAKLLMRALSKQMTQDDQVLLLGHEPNWDGDAETIIISGGISECMYQLEKTEESMAAYNDIGLLLAENIQQELLNQTAEWRQPEETVRATVLGAGTQTTNISGSTIQVECSELPLKNLPVYEIPFDRNIETGLKKIAAGVQEAVSIYDPAKEGQNFALYLTDLPYLRFQDIQTVSNALLQANKLKPDPSQALVIVLESDHAKVVGQTLQSFDSKQSVVCVDQIEVEHGDYIDIGQALQSGVVPVVIKTLTFHST